MAERKPLAGRSQMYLAGKALQPLEWHDAMCLGAAIDDVQGSAWEELQKPQTGIVYVVPGRSAGREAARNEVCLHGSGLAPLRW